MNIDRIIGLSAWLATIGFIAAIIAGMFGRTLSRLGQRCDRTTAKAGAFTERVHE